MKNLKTNELPFVINGIHSNNNVLQIGGSGDLTNVISARAKKVCLIETDMNEFNRFIGARSNHDVEVVAGDGNNTEALAGTLADKFGKFDVILIDGPSVKNISEIISVAATLDVVVFISGGNVNTQDLKETGKTGDVVRYVINDHDSERKQFLKKIEKKQAAADNKKKVVSKPAVVKVSEKAPVKKVVGKPAVKGNATPKKK